MESLKMRKDAAKKAKKEMQQKKLEEHGLEYELAAHSVGNYALPLSASITPVSEGSENITAVISGGATDLGAQTVMHQRRRTPLETLEKKVNALQRDNVEMRRLLETVIQQLGTVEDPLPIRGYRRAGLPPRPPRSKFE